MTNDCVVYDVCCPLSCPDVPVQSHVCIQSLHRWQSFLENVINWSDCVVWRCERDTRDLCRFAPTVVKAESEVAKYDLTAASKAPSSMAQYE